MRRSMILIVIAVALGAGGCVVSGTMSARAHVRTPTLVYVSPGVQVVEDYHEPVFYSDGYYWRYHGGVWYRSHVHYGSWARVTVVPHRIRRIDRPHVYVHYRAGGRGRAVGHHRAPAERPKVRDHRGHGHGHVKAKAKVKVKKREKRKDDRGRVKVRDHRR